MYLSFFIKNVDWETYIVYVYLTERKKIIWYSENIYKEVFWTGPNTWPFNCGYIKYSFPFFLRLLDWSSEQKNFDDRDLKVSIYKCVPGLIRESWIFHISPEESKRILKFI